MADTEPNTKAHKLASTNQTDPSKYYTNFLYKAVIISIFMILLPILPSQAPEFINQIGSWELLQLLLVGLAVSYGLFSRKTEETEKDQGSKFDNAHTYLTKFLQISSVFEDENDSSPEYDESRVQSWSNRYHREEPVLVVAHKSSVLPEKSEVSSVFAEKPLLLPVRSLKSRVRELDSPERINEPIGRIGSNSSYNFGSERFSSNSINVADFDSVDSAEKSNESIVLRSPIPWRSRSGRMEIKEESESIPLFSLPSETEEKTEDSEFHSFMPRLSIPSKPNSNSYPKNTLSASLSFPSQSKPKTANDLSRTKVYQKSQTLSPAPPPPPPPLPVHNRKPPLGKPKPISSREIGFAREEEKGKGLVLGSDDDETEEEGHEGYKRKGENEEKGEIVWSDVGPDVNKKADEFIAKFREQIRLQRIESIKRSTGQIARNTSS